LPSLLAPSQTTASITHVALQTPLQAKSALLPDPSPLPWHKVLLRDKLHSLRCQDQDKDHQDKDHQDKAHQDKDHQDRDWDRVHLYRDGPSLPGSKDLLPQLHQLAQQVGLWLGR
jgi:hypothetical protein